MILKRIYIFILEICKTFIEYYDNSCVGRCMSGICSFFGRKCADSRILTRFRNSFMSARYVSVSTASGVISFPFKVLKSIYSKFENKIESIKQKSVLLDFLRNVPNIRIRDIGKAVIAFCMGGLAVLIYKGFALSLGGLFLAVLLVAGVIMLAFGSTVVNTLS